jgi:hypothetical protein
VHFKKLSTPNIPSPVDSKTFDSFLLVFLELTNEMVTKKKSTLIRMPERKTILGFSDLYEFMNSGRAVYFNVHVFP